MKCRKLSKYLMLGILLSIYNTQVVCANGNIDGSENNGIVNVSEGNYGYIWGIQGENNNISTTKDNFANNAQVIIDGKVEVNQVYGGNAQLNAAGNYQTNEASNNSVVISNGAVVKTAVFGGYATSGQGSSDALVNTISKNNSVIIDNAIIEYNSNGNLYGNVAQNWQIGGTVIASGLKDMPTITIKNNSIINTIVVGNYAANIFGGNSDVFAENGIIAVENSVVNDSIYGGRIDRFNTSGKSIIRENTVFINEGADVKNIYAGMADITMPSDNAMEVKISSNKVIVTGGQIEGNVYGAYFSNEDIQNIAMNNEIILLNDSDLSNANLYGSNLSESIDDVSVNSGNDLIINGWKGKAVNSLNNFNNIKFQNIEWKNEGVVVEVLNNNATSSLENTKIDLRDSTTLAGGKNLNVNDYMYFIKTDNGTLATKDENILVNQNSNGDNIFTAGVAFEGTGEVSVEDNGNVKYTIKDIKATEQTESVGEGASIAAAFLVTGGDLVVEGLNAMEQDQLFGTKTFAIVEGHKSTYDVADDLKINGWNGLYGVGNIKQLEDANWSYAAFFENGIANYRTYNSFLGETFRGDGTVVYNGGGLAGRYKKDNGVYAEASLRAGLLKNDMENIFRDGNGNNYGYKTETPYYAFHAGIGKLFSVNESTDWDLYTRYYHTYNDGDNFSVAGDKFEVDSLTSDRLRIGTRYITNKNNQWSTYYGLAWEYEFNGDSDVKVNGTSLETETLEGSSYFAEIGFNYQKEKTSPWSFEGRLRGYAGVREGISGILRATYSF